MNEQLRLSWENELAKCIKCGTCRSVCPIVKAIDNESGSARGKLKIIEHLLINQIPLSGEFEEIMNKCVMCKACTTSCPSGVNTYKVFLEIRQHLASKKGLPMAKKSVFKLMKQQSLFDQSLRLGAKFQHTIFKDAPNGVGKVARIPLPVAGFNQRRIIPSLAKEPFRTTVPEVIKVATPQSKVAFFTGCMFNYIYPQLGRDLVEILMANQIEVIVPKEQQCCATPLFTSGETRIAKTLIQRNLEVFDALDVDAIITGCGSCGLAWKKEFLTLLDESDPLYEVAERLSAKTYDISEYMVKFGLSFAKLPKISETITYHDSCHLNRGQKVKSEPREILKALAASSFVEMKDADICCGSGGSFNLMYYELSKQINQQKLENIQQTKADLVVTGCPACIMHITDGLEQQDSPIKVKHIVELVAEGYRKQKGVN